MRSALVRAAFAAALSMPALGLVQGARAEHVPGELIVRFAAGVTAAGLDTVSAAKEARPTGPRLPGGWQVLRLAAGEGVEAALARWRAVPGVVAVQPNYRYRAAVLPNDPFFQAESPGLTHLHDPAFDLDIDAPEAWAVQSDCSPVVIAVLDTGVNGTHLELTENLWDDGGGSPGYDFVDDDPDPSPDNAWEDHGTHVAGILAARGNNAQGIAGLCWQARLMLLRVLDEDGIGTTARIAAAIQYAVEHGARVLNLSIGGQKAFDQVLSDALNAARAAGALVVVAAGNEGVDLGAAPDYPCSFPQENLVCVGAATVARDADGESSAWGYAPYSNWGDDVDLAAPGDTGRGGVLSTWPGFAASLFGEAGDIQNWSVSPDGGWSTDGGGPDDCVPLPVLVTPPGWCDYPPYPAPATVAIETTVSGAVFEGAVDARIGFFSSINIDPAHDFRLLATPSTAPPGFDPLVQSWTGVNNPDGVFAWQSFALTGNCTAGDCVVRFELESDTTPPSPAPPPDGEREDGVALGDIRVQSLQIGSTAYQAAAGTSMAAPQVAGVAALLWSHNPDFTAADVRRALLEGGVEDAAFAGRVTSGRVLNARGALDWIDPPEGLRAEIER